MFNPILSVNHSELLQSYQSFYLTASQFSNMNLKHFKRTNFIERFQFIV